MPEEVAVHKRCPLEMWPIFNCQVAWRLSHKSEQRHLRMLENLCWFGDILFFRENTSVLSPCMHSIKCRLIQNRMAITLDIIKIVDTMLSIAIWKNTA